MVLLERIEPTAHRLCLGVTASPHFPASSRGEGRSISPSIPPLPSLFGANSGANFSLALIGGNQRIVRDHIPARRSGLRVRVGEQVELVKLQIVQVRASPAGGAGQSGGHCAARRQLPCTCHVPHLLPKAAVEAEHPVRHPQLADARRVLAAAVA